MRGGVQACSLPGRVLREANVPRGGVDPKTVRRDKPPDNPEGRKEMKAIASKRRRFGYPLPGSRNAVSMRGADRRAVGAQRNVHEP